MLLPFISPLTKALYKTGNLMSKSNLLSLWQVYLIKAKICLKRCMFYEQYVGELRLGRMMLPLRQYKAVGQGVKLSTLANFLVLHLIFGQNHNPLSTKYR